MNQDRLAGICRQFSGRITENWGKLTNNQEIANVGARKHLAGRIQERYGLSKETAAHELKDFFARNRLWDTSNR